jgi:hypothetical protein
VVGVVVLDVVGVLRRRWTGTDSTTRAAARGGVVADHRRVIGAPVGATGLDVGRFVVALSG